GCCQQCKMCCILKPIRMIYPEFKIWQIFRLKVLKANRLKFDLEFITYANKKKKNKY
ncbi:hypothetical protein L9F63_027520, partial [Diploptera punctata]